MKLCSCLQSALRLKPTFTDAYNNMASALVQKGLIPQAVECYNAALQINPNLVTYRCYSPCKAVTVMHDYTPPFSIISGNSLFEIITQPSECICILPVHI